jgi:hypothetical protein
MQFYAADPFFAPYEGEFTAEIVSILRRQEWGG